MNQQKHHQEENECVLPFSVTVESVLKHVGFAI